MKRHYFTLWLLLVLALVIVMVIAFSDELQLGQWQVRKAPIAETLLAKPDTSASQSSVNADTVATKESAEEPMDTVPKNILLFGDSMTFGLARRFADYGVANGHNVTAINWDSSTSAIWADCDTLEYYIRKYNADFIVVVLGSNELYRKDHDKYRLVIEKLVHKIGDIPFIWVGPPDLKADGGMNDVYLSVLGPRRFFMTKGMELERGKDHIHPVFSASAQWADSIMQWMPKSAHPILNKRPTPDQEAEPTIVFLKPKHR